MYGPPPEGLDHTMYPAKPPLARLEELPAEADIHSGMEGALDSEGLHNDGRATSSAQGLAYKKKEKKE